MLTQDVYLAVEAGMRVPAGLEMGPFAYCPELSDAAVAERHVLNRRMLLEEVRTTPAELAAFSA